MPGIPGFDDTVAWLAVETSKTAISELLRVAWPTVGAIVNRVWAGGGAAVDPLAGLRRVGIDEISYKRGHRLYLMVVVDHDTGSLRWGAAAPGHDKATLGQFFDLLGHERCAQISLWSAPTRRSGSPTSSRRSLPNATLLCLDAFHLVKWVTEALDDVRRGTWNDAL